MNQKELRELIEFLIDKDISEFELERGDVKVRIKRGVSHIVVAPTDHPVAQVHAAQAAVPATPEAPRTSAPAAAPPKAEEELHEVKSPIVGTFYESPSPGS